MYLDPRPDLMFGDIFEANWLFDAYLRADSGAMFKRAVKGEPQPAWFRRGEPTGKEDEQLIVQATMDPDDVVLTVGTRRAAIVLTDDCEIATLASRRGSSWAPRGRILMGSIRNRDGIERDDLELGIHTLSPDDDGRFPGGLVDFNRLIEVQTKGLLDAPDKKLLSLDDEARISLAERFGGHILRQGPLAAELGAKKLVRLLTAGDDADRMRAFGKDDWGDDALLDMAMSIVEVTDETWFVGRLVNEVDELTERLLRGTLTDGAAEHQRLCRHYAKALRAIAESAQRGAEAFERATDDRGPRSGTGVA